MKENVDSKSLLNLTTKIVAAYLYKNRMPENGVSGLISMVFSAVSGTSVETESGKISRAPQNAAPAVMPKRTIFPDYILCLEDGRKLKTLKRHLRAAFGLSPEQYREKWGLPQDYPMVAPNYAQKRSVLARNLGLGRKGDDSGAEREAEGSMELEDLSNRTTPQLPASVARVEKAETVLDVFTPEPKRGREPNLDAVFARFPKSDGENTPEPSPETIGGSPKRVPFSKQRARPMRK